MAPARCISLRVVGRRHFGPRGASGKWSHTPAGRLATASCAAAFRSKCLLLPLLRFYCPRPRNPLVKREPLSTGPRHRGSHRQEGGDGGGAGRGHSPPRARLPWIRNITAATSQVGQELGGQGGGCGVIGYSAGLGLSPPWYRGGRPRRRSLLLGARRGQGGEAQIASPVRCDPKVKTLGRGVLDGEPS